MEGHEETKTLDRFFFHSKEIKDNMDQARTADIPEPTRGKQSSMRWSSTVDWVNDIIRYIN